MYNFKNGWFLLKEVAIIALSCKVPEITMHFCDTDKYTDMSLGINGE